MKLQIIPIAIIALLVSCDHSDPGPATSPVVRTIHNDYRTGEKIGEMTYTYDSENRLIKLAFNSNVDWWSSSEITYEFDAAGELVKKVTGFGPSGESLVEETTYKNGLKDVETSYYAGQTSGQKTQYFYTGDRIDSTRIFSFPEDDPYAFSTTIVYEYDDKGRLVKRGVRGNQYDSFEYDENGRLMSTCNTDWRSGVALDCVANEYDDAGNLLKVYDVSHGVETNQYLKEEYFYKDGRLDEKRTYQWIYTRGPSPDITQIKYVY